MKAKVQYPGISRPEDELSGWYLSLANSLTSVARDYLMSIKGNATVTEAGSEEVERDGDQPLTEIPGVSEFEAMCAVEYAMNKYFTNLTKDQIVDRFINYYGHFDDMLDFFVVYVLFCCLLSYVPSINE